VASGGSGVRVLIAEDETIIRLDLRTQLEQLGYVVCGEARDGDEAVELAARLAPDVAILDVKMPNVDGIEAARRILANRSVAIVLLTAYSDRELVERATRAGVSGYLVKPFHPSDLLPAIERELARTSVYSRCRPSSVRPSQPPASISPSPPPSSGIAAAGVGPRSRRGPHLRGQPGEDLTEALVVERVVRIAASKFITRGVQQLAGERIPA
jgi:DNA-binding NarL/FixJ family response regulator